MAIDVRDRQAAFGDAAARWSEIITGDVPPVFLEGELIDDVLDYSSAPEETGKNIGDDLAEGKPTLPLIYAMRNGSPQQVKAIRQAIENGGRSHIKTVLEAIESTNAIAYTAQAAQREADTAIEALAELPASPYKEALYGLAEFSVNRSY